MVWVYAFVLRNSPVPSVTPLAMFLFFLLLFFVSQYFQHFARDKLQLRSIRQAAFILGSGSLHFLQHTILDTCA